MDHPIPGSRLIWLLGPTQARVRLQDGRIWIPAHRDTQESAAAVLSLAMRLHGAKGHPEREPAGLMVPRGYPIRVPAAGRLLIPVLSLMLFAMSADLYAKGLPILPLAMSTGSIPEILLLVLGGIVAWVILQLVAASSLSQVLHGPHALAYISWRGLCIDPAAWALCGSLHCSASILIFAMALSAFAFTSGQFLGWLSAGLFAGSLLYLAIATYPLRHGPASAAFARLAHVSDLPTSLRLAFAGRFLPVGQKVRTGSGKIMGIAALGFFLWAALCGQAIAWAGQAVPPLGLPGMIWTTLSALFSGLFAIFLFILLIQLWLSAQKFRGRGSLEPLPPDPGRQTVWEQKCALLRHVPELAQADWKWTRAPTGYLLIRQGDRERTFHWIESGHASVIGRDSSGDLLPLASLQAGSGVGEQALLDGEPRNADVIMESPSVLVSLHTSSADWNEETRERFRNFVLASQAMDHCPELQAISRADKERWLAAGSLRQVHPQEFLIRQGDTGRWMGLVIAGEASAFRYGESIGALIPGNLVGEMGFLTRSGREADVQATKPLSLWVWEADWMDAEVDRMGIRELLVDLAELRRRQFQ